MKKRFLVAAMAAAIVSPIASYADATVYGRIHASLDHVNVGDTSGDMNLSDRKSAFGVKGKDDLGAGMSVLYKVEWSFDPADGTAIGTRDRWVGLKMSGLGSVKFGTMSSNWKQTAAKVDPFWHTAAEGRNEYAKDKVTPNGIGITSSKLSGGLGDDRGRATNVIQYKSPKFSGVHAVMNVTANGTGDYNSGFGLRYKTKNLFAFVDAISLDAGDTTEDATKLGATYKGLVDGLTIGGVIENSEDLVGADYKSMMATYALTDTGTVLFSYGNANYLIDTKDSHGAALGYAHSLGKRTSVYAALMGRTFSNSEAIDDANNVKAYSFGLKHKF